VICQGIIKELKNEYGSHDCLSTHNGSHHSIPHTSIDYLLHTLTPENNLLKDEIQSFLHNKENQEKLKFTIKN